MRERKTWGKRRRMEGGSSFLCSLLMAATLALIAAGARGAQLTYKGAIEGHVIGPQGQLAGIRVQLIAPGERPEGEVYTDSNGGFFFGNLLYGRYWIVIQAQEYRPVRLSVLIERHVLQPQVEVALERAVKRSKPTAIRGSPGSYKLDARNPIPPFDSKVLHEFEKGRKLQLEGNLPKATVHYQRALQLSPDFYPALNNLGTIYLRQNDHVRARAAFLRSLELNPDEGEPYINLGRILYAEGQYRQALERLEAGLKRSPQSAIGHYFLGSAYLKLGELEKAEPALKLAYSLDPPRMAFVRLQLANLYLQRHDMQAASVELEGYLQANPSDPQAPAIRKTLARIRER